jgi:hypothetical protein
MQAGFAVRDVTPAVGSLMAAFPRGPARVPRRAEGVRDRLYVRALALSDGATKVCIGTGDLLLWQNEDVARVRRRAAEQTTGLPAEHIHLAATHTHSTGENSYLFGGRPNDPWVMALREKMISAITEAEGRLAPAGLRVGRVDAPYNFNRRVVDEETGRAHSIHEYQVGVTEGVTDPALSVLRLDLQDHHNVYWVHWTAHGVTLGPGNSLFSADYPGKMAARVEAVRPNTHVLFTNGAAGNIHPRWAIQDEPTAQEKVGRLLADKVLLAGDQAQPVLSTTLKPVSTIETFRNRADPDLTAVVEVACLEIGPVVIGFLPGEPYVEFQLQFRKALEPRPALLVGYANGWNGYIPTREAFAQGGYGVDFFPTDQPPYSRTMLPPGAGEQLLAALLNLVGSQQVERCG